MSPDPTAAWANLAANLRSRYPDDWAERYQSYQDGYNPDLRAWRAIGGNPYAPTERQPRRANPALEARNRRILAASRNAVPVSPIAERFGLTASAIHLIVASFGERVVR